MCRFTRNNNFVIGKAARRKRMAKQKREEMKAHGRDLSKGGKNGNGISLKFYYGIRGD